jgi:molybdopterin/thiamine biosynthesis adenylyltransferase
MKKIDYNSLFSRNIGVFTEEQQEKIKGLKIAIAGVGGLGGSVAYSLARLGVGELRLADPEKFEESNINRQFGAYIDTVGSYKSQGVAKDLIRINPELKIKIWNEPLSKDNMDSFLDGVDVVIDGMEFFETGNELELHRSAVKRGLWVFMLQGVNNITTFLSFDPRGETFEEMFCRDGKISLPLLISKMFPRLPKGASPESIKSLIEKYENGESIHFSSYSVLAPMGGTFVVEELIKVIVRGEQPAEVAPNIFSLDLEDMTITHYDGEGNEIKK